jgi:Ca2+-binding RTX toxin-like protein
MLGRALIGPAAVVGMLLVAEPAAASQAFVSMGRVHYVAAPGETNTVVLEYEPSGLRLSDAGATVAAGSGCVQDGAEALCAIGGPAEMVVALGDGDDVVDLSETVFAIVSGGAGNDRITGSLGQNRLDGGPGNDTLSGGEFADMLIGGAGDDDIVGGQDDDSIVAGPGDDFVRGGLGWDDMSGGPGNNTLNGNSGYDGVYATGDVNFLLKPGLLVGLGRDRLTDVEGALIFGGPGDNVLNARAWKGDASLVGLRGGDVLVGGIGTDYLDGGMGDDRLAGGRGNDELSGGVGNDTFLARDRFGDFLDGTFGVDRAWIDPFDFTVEVERLL